MKHYCTLSISICTIICLQMLNARAGAPLSEKQLSLVATSGFIENKGQFLNENKKPRTDLLYLFQSNGIKVQLMSNRISFELYTEQPENNFDEATGTNDYSERDPEDRPTPALRYESSRLDVEFIGANQHPDIVADEVSPCYFNYYLAYTAEQGITQVHQYNKITYNNLYPNIDLVLVADPHQHSNQSIAYDFVIHPGGNVNDIRYRYHGMMQQSQLADGSILTTMQQGKITERIPGSFLVNASGVKSSAVPVSFHLENNIISFHASSYDRKQSLVIDPELSWATYCGGSVSEEGRGLATDSLSNVATIGRTNSTNNIATSGAYQTTLSADVDIFFEKYDSTGQRLWGTYYGGSAADHGRGLVADANNNFYLGCHTDSPDGCATAGSYKPTYSGGAGDDALLAYFSSAGFRIWATYYGGTDDETIRRLSIDHDGNVIMVGYTKSANGIATPGAYQTTYAGATDLILSKWTPGGQLIWGTYLGGDSEDHGRSVEVDKDNNIYINGSTGSETGIATPNSYRNHIADKQDFLLGKFSTDGDLLWTSYWGGALEDRGRGVFVDSSSRYVYFTGYSASDTGVATPGAYQQNLIPGIGDNGDPYHDMVVMKWTVDGEIVWSSYLGGSKDDRGRAITMIGDDEIYISGSTESSDAIATADGFQTVWGGKGDMFLEIWDSNGTRNYGTYFGGAGDEDNLALAVDDKHQNIYLIGTGQSTNLGTPGTAQPDFAGVDDALLAKIRVHGGPPPSPVSSFTYVNVPCTSWKVSFTNTSVNADTYKWTFGDGHFSTAVSPTHTYTAEGTYMVKLKATNSSTGDFVNTTIAVQVATAPMVATISPSGTIAACKNVEVTLTCNNTGSDLSYQWRKNGTNISGATNQTYVSPKDAADFDVIVTSTLGCSGTSDPVTITRLKIPSATITPLGNLDICSTGSVDLQANYSANFLYQWKRNSLNISGATAQTYHATQTGAYKVVVTNANGCTRISKPVTVSSSCKLAAMEDAESTLEIFPNPASSIATVSFFIAEEKRVTIVLTDISGRLLQTIFSGISSEGNHELDFSCKSLPSGIYFLKMTAGKEIRNGMLVVE